MNKERSHQRCRFMIQGPKTEPVIVNFQLVKKGKRLSESTDSLN